MDLEKWTVLLRALDRGSLSAAAEELGYTPSGVSRAVAALEEELGVPLLARLHRGVAPTRECQALLPMAREMVHLSSLLAQRSDELRGLVSGSLSVGTAYHHYYPWLSRMIAGFTRRYPGVTINLLEGTSSELCQAVRERRADLCIASRREGPFRWTPIHEGPLVVLVPERHPLAEGDRVPIDALRTEPFIELNPGLETDNSRFFAKYDLHPNTRFTTSDPTAVRSIVSAVCATEMNLHAMFPQLQDLPLHTPNVTFITTQELEDKYPDLTPKERENAIVEENGTTFLMKIGAPLKSGKPHDGRAPDYDDWDLNGDLLFWNEPLQCSYELSSMGIRVSPESMDKQLTMAGCDDRRALPFHKAVLAGELPYTIGGGIGQSRLCMLLLGSAHIGEVQASVWDNVTREACEKAGIPLL